MSIKATWTGQKILTDQSLNLLEKTKNKYLETVLDAIGSSYSSIWISKIDDTSDKYTIHCENKEDIKNINAKVEFVIDRHGDIIELATYHKYINTPAKLREGEMLLISKIANFVEKKKHEGE